MATTSWCLEFSTPESVALKQTRKCHVAMITSRRLPTHKGSASRQSCSGEIYMHCKTTLPSQQRARTPTVQQSWTTVSPVNQ